MKSWKEVPHLFANGKFKVEVNSKHHEAEIFELIGLEGVVLTIFKDDSTLNILPDYCTLIARPISNMSDEELEGFYNTYRDNYWEELESFGWTHESLKEGFSAKGIEFEQGLYLLSMGVYPFDQSHFESGEVIARYENK